MSVLYKYVLIVIKIHLTSRNSPYVKTANFKMLFIMLHSSDVVIIDQLSIERHHLLMRTHMIGCHPCERSLPPRTIVMTSHPSPNHYKLLTQLPNDYIVDKLLSASNSAHNSHHGKRGTCGCLFYIIDCCGSVF